MKPTVKEVLATLLKELHKQRGVTQQQVDDITRIVLQNMRGYECGDNSPRADILVAIADYFGVSTDYLLGRSDYNA